MLDEIIKSFTKNYQSMNNLPFSMSKSNSSSLVLKYESVSSKDRKDCCQIKKLKLKCICGYTLYKVRPYVYEILRALQPFFEIVAVSNIEHFILE